MGEITGNGSTELELKEGNFWMCGVDFIVAIIGRDGKARSTISEVVTIRKKRLLVVVISDGKIAIANNNLYQ